MRAREGWSRSCRHTRGTRRMSAPALLALSVAGGNILSKHYFRTLAANYQRAWYAAGLLLSELQIMHGS